jgi:hypothetical protein
MIYIKKKVITTLFIAGLFCSCSTSQTGTNDNSMVNYSSEINYELLVNDSLHSIVVLKEPLDKEIDTSKLIIIADSLFKNKPHNSSIWQNYGVRFYYVKDWKGKVYYAKKEWLNTDKPDSLNAQPLDVTGITYNDKQDEINHAKRHPPIQSSFDTAAYLTKIKEFSKKKIKQLVKMQLDNTGEVKPFIELCKHRLDSAGITTNGKDNYSYLYRDHFIYVWGFVFYPVTKNNYSYTNTVSFEGSYDIFGNQVYFKSSLTDSDY